MTKIKINEAIINLQKTLEYFFVVSDMESAHSAMKNLNKIEVYLEDLEAD